MTLTPLVTTMSDFPLYNPCPRGHQGAKYLSRGSPGKWWHFLKLNFYFPGRKLLFKFDWALMCTGKWALLVQYQGHLERSFWGDDTGVRNNERLEWTDAFGKGIPVQVSVTEITWSPVPEQRCSGNDEMLLIKYPWDLMKIVWKACASHRGKPGSFSLNDATIFWNAAS